jgi:hypothetical protein
MTTKPALSWNSHRAATSVLDAITKAALIDLVIDLVAQDGAGGCDDEVTAERLMRHLGPVLTRRGDRAPHRGGRK